MEIERKFLIDSFPDLPLIEQAVCYQGYLSVRPVVRIRKKVDGDIATYKLCFKGKGTIARQEVELDITEEVYEQLVELLQGAPVRKDYRVYRLPGGERLECSLVDPGEPTEFMYAEVEFATLEEARRFAPPGFLNREVTEQPGYSMGSYWSRKHPAVCPEQQKD